MMVYMVFNRYFQIWIFEYRIQKQYFNFQDRIGRREIYPYQASRYQKKPPSQKRNGGIKEWRRPTLPQQCAVPSALAVLTSLFGMGRGGTPPQQSPKAFMVAYVLNTKISYFLYQVSRSRYQDSLLLAPVSGLQAYFAFLLFTFALIKKSTYRE